MRISRSKKLFFWQKSLNLILVTLLFVPLCSCGAFIEPMPKGWGLSPRPLTGMRNFPPANTSYGKGFQDGCHNGWDAVAKGLVADWNRKKVDAKSLTNNSDYNTGYWDGFEQCTYILDWDVV